MNIMIKCCECNRTQLAECDTTANITLTQGSVCEGCGVEFNLFSIHCMKTEEANDPKE